MKKAVPAGRQGFTLVELLVAISIGVMLIIGGSIAANSFNSRERVDAVTSQINEVVNSARNYAMTRQKPTGYTADSVEYVVVTLATDGRIKIIAGNNHDGIGVGYTYLDNKIDIQNILISPIKDGNLIFSAPQGKLLQYHDDTVKTLAEPVDETVHTVPVVMTIDSDLDATNWKNVSVSATGAVQSNIHLECPELCPGKFSTEYAACQGQPVGCTAKLGACVLDVPKVMCWKRD